MGLGNRVGDFDSGQESRGVYDMKCKLIDGYQRHMIVTDIPSKDGLPTELEITISYTDRSSTGNASKAIVLDNIISPLIVKALNNEH
jgi:hypothetical protein